jgi:hypothetical protein
MRQKSAAAPVGTRATAVGGGQLLDEDIMPQRAARIEAPRGGAADTLILWGVHKSQIGGVEDPSDGALEGWLQHDMGGPRSATERMSDRLQSLGLHRLALQLRRCAARKPGSGSDWRCGTQVCPRCSRSKALKSRKSIERCLLKIPERSRVMVTLTIAPSGDIDADRALLVRSFALLRHRACWQRVVAWGRGSIEPEERAGLVHAHVVVRVAKNLVPVGRLRSQWQRILGAEGRVGQLDWRRVEPTAEDASRVAMYVSKRARASWAELPDDELLQLARAVPGKRWSLRFGRLETRVSKVT